MSACAETVAPKFSSVLLVRLAPWGVGVSFLAVCKCELHAGQD